MSFEIVEEFEKKIAYFFGAPFAVAVDSATHGIELCLRYVNAPYILCPNNTYISVPMLANKLNIKLLWHELDWHEYYEIYTQIYDAAVLWRKDSYIDGSLMCISFQYQKHLSLGRGGIILCPNKVVYNQLKKMSYDGRLPNIPWRQQNISTQGYHYYMNPEVAKIGLDKLSEAIAIEPRKWSVKDWPNLTKMDIFK